MTQYTDSVERHKLMHKAEKWAKGVRSLHAHALDSMWYALDRKDGHVMDIEYNNGLVQRTIQETGEILYFGKQLQGDKLLDQYERKG